MRKLNFVAQYEFWRTCRAVQDTFCDIYDGRIGKEFINPDGTSFLSVPYNFAIALNMDGFQPFKSTAYSCGAMYVSILNLPREERYTVENTVLVGVIPGPREPSKTINCPSGTGIKAALDWCTNDVCLRGFSICPCSFNLHSLQYTGQPKSVWFCFSQCILWLFSLSQIFPY